MFQAFYTPLSGESQRAIWMALLARSSTDALESGLGEHVATPIQWLRPPETGLMMVQGRAGGTGERFNLGEVTVTRCALRVNNPSGNQVGVAYVLGRTHKHARLAALADALLQDPAHRDQLDTRLLQPIRQAIACQREQRAASAATTKVEFFTVAREAGAPEPDEGNE